MKIFGSLCLITVAAFLIFSVSIVVKLGREEEAAKVLGPLALEAARCLERKSYDTSTVCDIESIQKKADQGALQAVGKNYNLTIQTKQDKSFIVEARPRSGSAWYSPSARTDACVIYVTVRGKVAYTY